MASYWLGSFNQYRLNHQCSGSDLWSVIKTWSLPTLGSLTYWISRAPRFSRASITRRPVFALRAWWTWNIFACFIAHTIWMIIARDVSYRGSHFCLFLIKIRELEIKLCLSIKFKEINTWWTCWSVWTCWVIQLTRLDEIFSCVAQQYVHITWSSVLARRSFTFHDWFKL